MLKRTFSACAAMLALTATASWIPAGEFNAGHISKDASWFAHLDLEAGADSKIFEELTTAENPNQPSRLSQWLSTRYGIDAEKLDGLTLYSLGDDQSKTVALLYGQIQEDKLLDTVKRQADVSSREVGNVTYHSWKVNVDKAERRPNDQVGQRSSNVADGVVENQAQRNQSNPDRPADRAAPPAAAPQATAPQIEQEEAVITAAFLEDVAIFAKDMNTAEQAVNTIQNKQGLDTTDKLRVQEAVRGEVLLQAVVLDVSSTQAMRNRAPASTAPNQNQQQDAWAVMDEIDTISVAIGELNENQAFVAVEAKAKSEDAAKQVNDVLNGLRALAALSQENGGQAGNRQGFDLGALEPDVEQEGTFLRMGWTLNVDQIADMLNRQLDRDDTRRPAVETPRPAPAGATR